MGLWGGGEGEGQGVRGLKNVLGMDLRTARNKGVGGWVGGWPSQRVMWLFTESRCTVKRRTPKTHQLGGYGSE